MSSISKYRVMPSTLNSRVGMWTKHFFFCSNPRRLPLHSLFSFAFFSSFQSYFYQIPCITHEFGHLMPNFFSNNRRFSSGFWCSWVIFGAFWSWVVHFGIILPTFSINLYFSLVFTWIGSLSSSSQRFGAIFFSGFFFVGWLLREFWLLFWIHLGGFGCIFWSS